MNIDIERDEWLDSLRYAINVLERAKAALQQAVPMLRRLQMFTQPRPSADWDALEALLSEIGELGSE